MPLSPISAQIASVHTAISCRSASGARWRHAIAPITKIVHGSAYTTSHRLSSRVNRPRRKTQLP